MKRVKITKAKMVSLAIAAKKYIAEATIKNETGQDVENYSDKLAWACKSMLENEPNIKSLDDQNKAVEKIESSNKKIARNLSIDHAELYTEGPLKGTFILDDKGNRVFTPSGQKLIDTEIDNLNEKYLETITKLMNSAVDFYIAKASVVPEALSQEFKTSLALLMPEAVK